VSIRQDNYKKQREKINPTEVTNLYFYKFVPFEPFKIVRMPIRGLGMNSEGCINISLDHDIRLKSWGSGDGNCLRYFDIAVTDFGCPPRHLDIVLGDKGTFFFSEQDAKDQMKKDINSWSAKLRQNAIDSKKLIEETQKKYLYTL
jgi:hypothetical protein